MLQGLKATLAGEAVSVLVLSSGVAAHAAEPDVEAVAEPSIPVE